MLDPISALGVAGNVLQIIDFGFNLVADGNHIYHSSTGALEENRAADEVAKDLEDLTKRLAESQDDWTKSHVKTPLEPDEIHLRNVCERCTEIAIELQRQLQKLGRQDGGKRRRLRSYKQALLSIWRKDQIDAIATRLARYQQELDTHILIGIRKSVRESEWKNSEDFASLERQTQQLTIAVLEGDDKVASRLNDQAEVLTRIYEHTSQILSSLGESKKATSLSFTNTTPASQPALPLHEAAHAGDSVKVRQLLRSSTIDINAHDENGCTALHLASTAEVAKRLLDRNINKDAEDNGGRTALHCAVLKRRLEVIKALLDAGVDSSIKDDMGKTPIFYAQECPTALWLLSHGPHPNVKAGRDSCDAGLLHMAQLIDMEGIQFFLKQGVNVNAQDAFGETALAKAARYGSFDIVNALFQAGASIELAADGKWTPLLLAVGANRLEVVQLLLPLGASKEARLKNGNSPLVEACIRGHFEIVEALVRSGCSVEVADSFKVSPLHLAVKADRITLVEMLLGRGVKVDSLDHDRVTPLFHAARMGCTEALKVLLARGANPNAISPEGCTALGLSCLEGHYDCTRLLLDHGVMVDDLFKTEEGYHLTPLTAAAHFGDTMMIRLLIDRGANIETRTTRATATLSIAASYRRKAASNLLPGPGTDLKGRVFGGAGGKLDLTPLMEAAVEGHDTAVELLLDLSARVDARNSLNATALHYAAIAGRKEMVAILLQAGADINAKNNIGATPLMSAAGRGYAEVVRVLLEANANTKLRDTNGFTAWNFAVFQGHDRKLEHLLKPDPETLLQLQREESLNDIAAYMHEVYR